MTELAFPTRRAVNPRASIRPDDLNGRTRYWASIKCADTGACLWHGGFPFYRKKDAQANVRDAMKRRPWEKGAAA